MTARTLVVDSGGTTRQIKRWAVVDSGGITRLLKRAFIVDAGGVSRLIFSAADDLSMLVGSGGAGGSNGYINGAFGTLTPNTLGDGSVVQEMAVAEMGSATPHQLVFSINGYPGTIVEAYLTSLSINSAVYLPGDANFTSFSGGAPGGTAQWIWQNAGIPTNGATIPIIVIRS